MFRPISISSLLFLALSACRDSGTGERGEPTEPEEMYARVQELLKPSAEREEADTAGAVLWLTRAAEAGHVQAMTDLGGLYLEGGKGVERSGAEALKWFRRAAEQGKATAYIFMGRILYTGTDDVEADPERAMEYWQKAADAGIPEAHFYLGSALIRFLPTAEDGVKHLELAAEEIKGQLAAAAATLLGSVYSKGLGSVQADAAKAGAWYLAGAKGGNPKSQLVYALMLLTGTHAEKNEESGMAYLRMAAGQDYPDAVILLINLLKKGEGAQENAAEIAAWEKRLETLRSAVN